jgi:hypothetical protein
MPVGRPFAKGKPRHPKAGRRRGTPNKGIVRARKLVMESDDKIIADKVIEAAKNGDVQAWATYYRYIRPPAAKVVGKPIDLKPPTTAQEARDSIALIARMIAIGAIDAEHGSRVVSALEAYLNAKAAELEAQVERYRAEEAGEVP